ncbi:hypothetical protein SJI19_17025 [Acerihabitans sp. TG2]|uniref:hypothetical protein n=1 Tax=Acerihabitans sp. TG2 TaxID=3096008 RepID=UPI002B227ACC|nr:hypothetical protein [Acerihabitans sp. TG2]MEA9392230.1 hypothetical protein [Acerihabitans sp. TG2]
MKAPKQPVPKILPPDDDAPTLDVTSNRADDDIKTIQFKVKVSKHTEIKTWATQHGMTMTQALMQGYELLKKQRG